MIAKVFKWTGAYLRLFFWKLRLGSRLQAGKRVYIGKHCNLSGNIRLDDGVYLSDYCVLQALNGGNIHIGKKTFFNTFSRVYAMEQVQIGTRCMLGSNVSIYDHDHDISKGVLNSTRTFVINPVCLEDYVWCGTNAVITRGCTIGSNCVVGAGAVANGSLEPNGVYAGVPAVRKRDIPTANPQV